MLHLMLWLGLLLVGAVAGSVGVAVLTLRYRYGPDGLALARLIHLRLGEIERGVRKSANNEGSAEKIRSDLLREVIETVPAKGPQRSRLAGDPWGRCGIGLAAISIACFAALAVTSGTSSPSADGLVATSRQDPDLARLELYARSKPSQARAVGPMSTPPGLPDVATMIERLATRLESQPEDAEGWRMLGWSYLHVEQPLKAVDAYARAVSLRPQSSEFRSAYGEALVAADSGNVGRKAVDAFNGALAIDAGNAKARYFLALGKAQAGDKKAALEELRGLQQEPPEDEAWASQLREQIASLARDHPLDEAGRASAATREGARADPHQPTPEAMRNIQALPIDQQQLAIRSMVDELAKRLEESPADEDGWLRLMRSRVVLGEQQAAREALARALAVFSGDAAAAARIAAAAKDLGISN
jgi:cytochrome c-type biogenesis protein CcmH